MSGAMQRHMSQSMGSELVLDVPQGSAVLFRRREANRPSQLWRMTAAGQLEHMGSVLLRRSERKTPIVLDVADEPQSCITLMIRRLDKGRASTQTWKFDGVSYGEECVCACCNKRFALLCRTDDCLVACRGCLYSQEEASGLWLMVSHLNRCSEKTDGQAGHTQTGRQRDRLTDSQKNDSDTFNCLLLVLCVFLHQVVMLSSRQTVMPAEDKEHLQNRCSEL